MPTARHALGVAATPGGLIYAIGGGSGGATLDTVEEYDPILFYPKRDAPSAVHHALKRIGGKA
jgi:hypothetical protein